MTKHVLALLLVFSSIEVSLESSFPSARSLGCDECKEEVVEFKGTYVCQAKEVVLSPWVADPNSTCECVCGEGERNASRTCGWYERWSDGSCKLVSEKDFPQATSTPCKKQRLQGKIKCDKQCLPEVQLLDEFGYTNCHLENYLCGNCTNRGTRLKYQKCKVSQKTKDFQCKHVIPDYRGLCGVKPVEEACSLEHTEVCVVKTLEVNTMDSWTAGTDNRHTYTAWDTFSQKCYLGHSTEDRRMGKKLTWHINEKCFDVCLNYENFLNVTIKTYGNDAWNGDVYIILENDLKRKKYSNQYKDLTNKKTGTYWRSY